VPVAPPGWDVAQPGIGNSLVLVEAVRQGANVPFVVSRLCDAVDTWLPVKVSENSTVPGGDAEARPCPSKLDATTTASPATMTLITRRRQQTARTTR